MESADRYALVLRRELRSAERLSEAAIFFGSVSLKTPCLRSSASLPWVTRCDQRFGDGFAADFLAEVSFRTVPGFWALVRRVWRATLRAADLCEYVCFRRRSTMTGSLAPKTIAARIRSPPATAGTLASQTRCLETLRHRFLPTFPVGLIRMDGGERSPNRYWIAALLSWGLQSAGNWSNAGWPAGMMQQFS